MDKEVLITVLSLIGTLIGFASGILISSKLRNYRIQQLEKKIDKHNNFAENIQADSVQSRQAVFVR